MTNIQTQFSSIIYAYEYIYEEISPSLPAPHYKDYFLNGFPFKIKRYHLSECGFLSGKNSEIKFIKKRISEAFSIVPSVDKHLFQGKLTDEIDALSKWERLYIEIFGCKYVVAHSCRSEKIRILGGNDDLKSCVNLKINTYKNKKEITPLHVRKIRQNLYLSIERNDIRIWRKEYSERNDITILRKSSYQDCEREIENLKWRIPVLYIIAHAYIRKIEGFIDEMSIAPVNPDLLYKEFLFFRLKRLRSIPVVPEKSLTSNEIWRFFSDYFNVEKNIEELNLIISDYQYELNSRQMYVIAMITFIVTFLGAFGLNKLF